MKRIVYISLASLVISLTSCDRVSPEITNAFKGEYWMKTNRIYTVGAEEFPLNTYSAWTPVSIYEKRGSLYVQTELLGAPDFNNEHPKEIEGTRERPDFIAPHKLPKEEGDTTAQGIENVETGKKSNLVCVDGNIILISHGVLAQTLPIKVKSGSEAVLNLESYKPVEVELTDETGTSIGKIHAWYEYGPMVKKGDTITWDVEYMDDYTPSNGQEKDCERIIHRNTLYKR